MKRAAPEGGDGAPEQIGHAPHHFPGGLVREGQQQDAVGGDALFQEEGDSVDQCPRLAGAGAGGPAATSNAAPPYGPDRIVVRLKPNVTTTEFVAAEPAGSQMIQLFSNRLAIIQVPSGRVPEFLQSYKDGGLVEYAEPDVIYHAFVTPNDPQFTNQWALNNTGQSGGTPGADIKALQGWDIRSQATNVIVAITDTGARMTHEDLTNNLWVNAGEIPGNGIDDDNDGWVDDVHGINLVAVSGDPTDDSGHGTHVAGIIAAQGNNAKGISGVVWQGRLMILKWLDSHGSGNLSDAITALEFARTHGASIVNASWGGPYYVQALYDEISTLRSSGIIFVAAAGNDALDNDVYLTYPACYQLDNIVSVAASTASNTVASFSCFGYQSVGLGAPGTDILSTYFGSDTDYYTLSGTSMAAPHAAGALALLKAAAPTDSYRASIYRLLLGVTSLSAFQGNTDSGGVLNLYQSLSSVVESSPPNNNFTNSQALSGAATTVYGLNIGATKETGEPNHAGNAGGASIWYSWTAPSAGRVEMTTARSITTTGSTLNTLLGVYTGSSVSALTTIASNDDSGINGDGTTTSRATFNSTPGTTYRIAVDGYNRATGLVRLSINYAARNDDLASSERLNGPHIAVQGTTLGAGKEAGEPAHAGNAGGRSIWWSWVAPENGTVTLTSEGSTFDTLLAVYTGSAYPLTAVASNDNDTSTHADEYGQRTSTVTFTATAGTTYRIAIDGAGGAAGHFVLAGGYQYNINTPLLGASYPKTAVRINRAGHYTGQTVDVYPYFMGASQVTLSGMGIGEGSGLNDVDQVVGQAGNHAVLWDATLGLRRLDASPSSSISKGISNPGLPVGAAWYYECQPLFTYPSAAYWANNNFSLLPDLGGGNAVGTDVNDLNEIVGYGYSSRSGCTFYNPRAAYWGQLSGNGAGTIDLGTLGGSTAVAAILGAGGDITGSAGTPQGRYFAALFRDQKVINAGTLGDGKTYGYGSINDRRQAAVQFQGDTYLNRVNEFGWRAGLWQNGVLIDLNKLIPAQPLPTSGWESVGAGLGYNNLYPHDINHHGTMVGSGVYKSSDGSEKIAVFVLSPSNYLQLQAPSLSQNNIFSFTVEGASGTVCTVEASADCLSWTQIGSVTLQNGSGTFTDNNSSQYSSRFYRVKNGSETCGDVVGFVILQLPAGKSMVANPFDSPDNRIPALLSGAPDLTTVYKFDEATQNWLINTKTFNGEWASYPLMTLYPGEGVVIDTTSSFTVKFFGRIRQNSLEKIVSSQLAVHSTLAPLAGAIDTNLGFPACNGDAIYIMIDTAGNYQTYTYNNGSWSPGVPSVPLGTAFWSSKAAGAK